MSNLEKRITKLEDMKQADNVMSTFGCEKQARAVMEELKRDRELRESMTPEEYAAHRQECMENAPADSPLGRLRELRRQRMEGSL